MAFYDENDLFRETVEQARTDRQRAQAREQGLRTFEKARLYEITNNKFEEVGWVPIVGPIFGAFQRILRGVLSLFGFGNDE